MSAGLIGSITNRSTFQRFRRPDGRARGVGIRVAYVELDAQKTPVQAAFSVTKRCGGAVVRNRIRRRLRSALGEISNQLAPGAYLLSPEPEVATMKYDILIEQLTDATTRAARQGAR